MTQLVNLGSSMSTAIWSNAEAASYINSKFGDAVRSKKVADVKKWCSKRFVKLSVSHSRDV
jgi:hypothetical protein